MNFIETQLFEAFATMISGLAIDSRENANSIDPSSSHLGKLGVGSLKFSQLKATTSVSTLFI